MKFHSEPWFVNLFLLFFVIYIVRCNVINLFDLGFLQIDHSIVESFGGGGKSCITAKVYPTLAIGKDAKLFAFNYGTKSVVISEMNAWSVKTAQMSIEESNV